MRRFFALCTLLACAAATLPADEPGYDWPAGPDSAEAARSLEDSQRVCRDRVHTVRVERGLPALKGEEADRDEPLFIAAVDHRIDGCSVMVMRNDTRDVRPIPKPDERAPLLRRIQ
jgi:hypothetical protein